MVVVVLSSTGDGRHPSSAALIVDNFASTTHLDELPESSKLTTSHSHLIERTQARLSPVISKTISHYEILRKLGCGGMGEVYLSEDKRLGRLVALKFLPASYKYDSDRRARFFREARAASALRSPNVVAIHDIGEHDGILYIVMEYVEGELLSDRIERGSIALADAIDIAKQIADALDEAHSQGIIHRDIKGSNVIITESGLAKVLDFGIARITERATIGSDSDATIEIGHETEPGIILGTVSHMSPEQARGLKVDARTDIFSLGIVIYEMITGNAPFDGPTPTDVIAAIIRQDPLPLSHYSNEVPEELVSIVDKALSKNVDDRYQTVKLLASDLSTLKQRLTFEAEMRRSSPQGRRTSVIENSSGPQIVEDTKEIVEPGSDGLAPRTTSSAEYLVGQMKSHRTWLLVLGSVLLLAIAGVGYLKWNASPPAINSLAVLPFTNVSSDPDTEYLSDGIAESLINNLSQLPNLRMMSRSSAFRYKGRDIDPQAVGRELRVEAVLLGRIVQRGESLLINTELVNAKDNSIIWGAQYNRKLGDLLAVQEEISNQISEKLQLRLNGEDRRRLAKHNTENTEAYQLYLRGRFHWNKRTPAGLEKGIEFFERAISKDPAYAVAYSGLADCYNLLFDYNWVSPADSVPKAKAAAKKALEIDESLAEAHTSLAFAQMRYDWDWSGAEKEFKRAIELNPNYATAHHWYALYLASQKRFDDAKAEMRRAIELDPLSLIINTNVGWVYHFERKYDLAIEQYRKTLEMDPTFVPAHVKLGWAFEQKGMYDEAVSEVQKRMTLLGAAELATEIGKAYSNSGYKGMLRRWIDEWKSGTDAYYISPYSVAQLYAALGQNEQALEWLEKAYEERDGWLAYLAVEPVLDGLRGDPRFNDLLRRVGLAKG